MEATQTTPEATRKGMALQAPSYGRAIPLRVASFLSQNGTGTSLVRLIVEIVLALGIAMGGVAVMVQAGERVTVDVNLSPVLAGLVVLAVATSLPNTVVALILARTGRATACVEEIWSSNSINAALGIALPLVIWHAALHDDLLSFLDAPLMLLLTLVALLFVMTGRLGRYTGACFVVSYALWIGVHLFVGR